MRRVFVALSVVALIGGLSAGAEAKSKKKSYSIAKKECLGANSSMSGKPLRDCIKTKRK